MVDYKGDILTANNAKNPDLYWASRGGGGGQFGVVTSMSIQAHPTVDRVFRFNMTWHHCAFVQVFNWYQDAAPNAPVQITSHMKVHKGVVGFDGYSTGSEAQFWTWFNATAFDSHNIPKPNTINVTTSSYLDSIIHAAEVDPDDPKALFNDTLGNYFFKHTSGFAYQPLSNSSLEELISNMVHHPNCDTFLLLSGFGGAVADIGNSETAFPHRQNVLFMMQLGLLWKGNDSYQNVQDCLGWQRRTRKAVTKEMKGAYQNYADADLENYMDDYYGPNAARLSQVKHKYDPENVFQFQQSIP